MQREIGTTGTEQLVPVEGVRVPVAGPAPVPELTRYENVLDIESGVHVEHPDFGRRMIARMNKTIIETCRFPRRTPDAVARVHRATGHESVWRGGLPGQDAITERLDIVGRIVNIPPPRQICLVLAVIPVCRVRRLPPNIMNV